MCVLLCLFQLPFVKVLPHSQHRYRFCAASVLLRLTRLPKARGCLCFRWVLECTARLPALVKRLPHCSHLGRFSREWICLCPLRLAAPFKPLRSSVRLTLLWWVVQCMARLPALVKRLLHCWHLRRFTSAWICLCCRKFAALLKPLPQLLHLKRCSEPCVFSLCNARLPALVKCLPHCSHLWGFSSPWTCSCCLNFAATRCSTLWALFNSLCEARIPALEKLLPHWLCEILKCLAKTSALLNLFPHCLHWKGFSVECTVSSCRWQLAFVVKHFSHFLHCNRWISSLCVLRCLTRFSILPKHSPHCLHL